MDDHRRTATRCSLHAVAEQLLAGPQHRAEGTIRLRVTPGGFGQVAGPWRVEGADLVGPAGRVPLVGTVAEVARAAGIDPGAPDTYDDHADHGPGAPLEVDPAEASTLHAWFARGEDALRALVPHAEPVLWPEHFDLGVTADEVNFGVSPGDSAHDAPYAYVGPWTPRQGAFWNAPFGASHPAEALPAAADLLAWFERGRAEAARP